MPIKKMKNSYRKAKYIVYRETLIDRREHFWAFIGALAGMGVISFLEYLVFPKQDYIFLIGSFGASSVLVYGIIQSPLAQPRNLVGGHFVSAVIGVTVHKLVPDLLWIAAPVSVALSIIAMQMTKTLHPPGGATALIAVTGSQQVLDLGYWYVLTPVLSGSLILLATACIFNNIPHHRQYPAKNSKKIYKMIGRKFHNTIKIR